MKIDRSLSVFAAVTSLLISAPLYGAGPSGETPKPPLNTPPPVPTPAKVDSAATAPAPRIAFEEPVFDFGTVKPGKPVKHTFKVQNLGNQVLEIREVRVSCGCTTAGEWSRQIPPGETGVIPIQLSTERFRGPVSKSVTVASNDPRQPQALLQLKGLIWTPVHVTPSILLFPAIRKADEVQSRSIRISNQGTEPLKITEVTSTVPAFKPEVKELEPGKEFEIVVSTVPPLKVGANQGSIIAKTSSKESPVITVTAYATVLPAVQVVPSQIILPSGPLATETKRYVTIVANDPDGIEVSELKAARETFRARLIPAQPKRQFRVELTFPAGFQPENLDKITFKTSHPEFKKVEIPVTARR